MTEIVNKTLINNRRRIEELIEEIQTFLDDIKASDINALKIYPWLHSSENIISIDTTRSDISSSITLFYSKDSRVTNSTRIKVTGCRLDCGYFYDTDFLDKKIKKLLSDNKIRNLDKFKIAIMSGTSKDFAILLLFYT